MRGTAYLQKRGDKPTAYLTRNHSKAVIALLVMLSLASQLAGCVCFHPSVKHVPDTRPAKEGQKVEVREELPWPCKAFWGTLGVLSLFTAKPETRERERKEQEAKYLGEINRQYQETATRKTLR